MEGCGFRTWRARAIVTAVLAGIIVVGVAVEYLPEWYAMRKGIKTEQELVAIVERALEAGDAGRLTELASPGTDDAESAALNVVATCGATTDVSVRLVDDGLGGYWGEADCRHGDRVRTVDLDLVSVAAEEIEPDPDRYRWFISFDDMVASARARR